MSPKGRFQLHLPGLLKVLAEHLYSTQRVGVRELIQNAHDSCVRRALERSEPGYRPRIDLTIDPTNRLLRVADNGSGLSEREIHDDLTVIGRGYTRELRERLVTDDPTLSRELIGQFGIGFLSAFLLASEGTVETRPVGGPPLRCSSTGDEEFDLAVGDRLEPGTTVELRLKPSSLFLLHEDNLVEVVREYADFVPTPIHVHDSQSRAWHLAWALDQHCRICHELGKLDELAGHADHLAEVSAKRGQLYRTEAAGWIWRAVARRAKGDEKAASEAFHRAMNLLEGLDRRDSIVPDGVAAYDELGGELQAAIGDRDR